MYITALSPNLLALAQAAGLSELIRVNGVQLEVRRVLPQTGKGSGSATDARPRAPIVALHEGLGSVSMWATRSLDWLQALADHTSRATIAYSRQGYGASDDRPEVRRQVVGVELLERQVLHRAVAGGGPVEPTRRRLGERDQLLYRTGRQ